VPRCGGGEGGRRQVSKLPKLLHISSKLGEMFTTYGGGGGGGSIIMHNIARSKEGHFPVPIMGETPFPWLGLGSTTAYLESNPCCPLLIHVAPLFPTVHSHHKWNQQKQKQKSMEVVWMSYSDTFFSSIFVGQGASY
jgi:hypothetical protein